jgi:phage major head subunit gpT-like protein
MITPANWNILVSTVEVLIGQAWADTVPVAYTRLCESVPSASEQNVYPWTGMLPKMRLWNGPRVVFQAAPQTYALKNQTFEATLGIDRFVLDDDQYGVFYRLLPDMARQAKRQPDYMLRDLLENTGDQTGGLQNGLDGLTAFNTAHPVDFYNASVSSAIGSTYSNDFTGGGYTATINSKSVTIGGAFNQNSLQTAIEYMMLYPGEDGEALGVNPNTLMGPTLLRGEIDVVLKSSFFAPSSWNTLTGQVGAAENPLTKWGIEPIINPFLASSTKWYLADTTRGFMPFIHQTREATRMVPRTQENDPVVFDTHTFLWGEWDRQAVGWGPSFLFARSGS